MPNAIYLHYSYKEHTYAEHIKGMIEDLRKREIKLFEDVCDYPTHSELANFFPPFLKKIIAEIVK